MSNLTADAAKIFEAGVEPIVNNLPASNVALYEGSAASINASGYITPLAITGKFAGFIEAACDNSAGSAGDLNVKVRQRGVIKLSVAGATAITSKGSIVYATDGNTFTLTSTAGVAIGKIIRWISSGIAMVYFEAADLSSLGQSTTKFGYQTGVGGAVTQASNRTTAVTLSKLAGQITTASSSLAAEASADFTVTNTLVEAGDVVVVSIQSGSNGGGTIVSVATVADGSFVIRVSNGNAAAGTAETGAIIINFAVIKSVAA